MFWWCKCTQMFIFLLLHTFDAPPTGSANANSVHAFHVFRVVIFYSTVLRSQDLHAICVYENPCKNVNM